MTRLTGRPVRVARVAFGATVVCIALVARTYAQDDQFRRGLELIEKKQFQAAAGQLREAIQLKPMESTTKVRSGLGGLFGAGGTEYLPHFFLGQALFNAGDCVGAVTEWGTSEQQRAVESRQDLVKFLRNGYVECEKKGVLPPGKFEAAAERTLKQLTEVNGFAKSVAGVVNANLDVFRSDASTREQYERALGELQNGNKSYNAGRSSRLQRDLTDAEAAVERARTMFVTVESSLTAALDKQRSAQGLIRDVTEAISLAEALNTAVDAKRVAFTPSMTSAQQEGRDAIGRARERLSEGQKTLNPPTLTTARNYAVDAQNRFRQILEEVSRIEREGLQRVLSEALTRALEAFSLLDNSVSTLDRFLAERPTVLPADKAAEREAVQRDVDRARRRLDAARKSDNVAAIAAATQLATEVRDRLNLLIGAFGPLTLRDRGVREQLEAGARQFLGGEYQQAIASLGDAETLEPDVPLRLHFHLFKAASLYELFLRTRETDQALRAQALAEVEHCKAIDSAFQPDARAFSPRFLTFYQSVNAPAPPAAAAPAAPPQG